MTSLGSTAPLSRALPLILNGELEKFPALVSIFHQLLLPRDQQQQPVSASSFGAAALADGTTRT
jgi:hypothetical protein